MNPIAAAIRARAGIVKQDPGPSPQPGGREADGESPIVEGVSKADAAVDRFPTVEEECAAASLAEAGYEPSPTQDRAAGGYSRRHDNARRRAPRRAATVYQARLLPESNEAVMAEIEHYLAAEKTGNTRQAIHGRARRDDTMTPFTWGIEAE